MPQPIRSTSDDLVVQSPLGRTATGLGATKVGSHVRILGVRVDALTMSEAIERIHAMVKSRRPHLIFNLNVDICMQVQRDEELRGLFQSADMVLVDGTPMVWAARLLRSPVPERVSGSDFVPVLSSAAARAGYSLFLLGARPGVGERARAILEARYPGLRVAGTYSPPYNFERDDAENARIIRRIRDAAPDILLTAFGAPKDQQWLARFHTVLNVPVAMGVGSSLDYLAGTLRRAPRWMQRMGLEWAYRLIQEPHRLWRRYLVNDPPFFFLLFTEVLRQRGLSNWEGNNLGEVDKPGNRETN